MLKYWLNVLADFPFFLRPLQGFEKYGAQSNSPLPTNFKTTQGTHLAQDT